MNMEIDYEISSMVILFLPLIQEGLLSVTCEKFVQEVLINHFINLAQGNSVVT